MGAQITLTSTNGKQLAAPLEMWVVAILVQMDAPQRAKVMVQVAEMQATKARRNGAVLSHAGAEIRSK